MSMKQLVNPHGSDQLKPLLLTGDELAAEKKRAENLPKILMSSREVGDLIMLGIGGFTPLTGFMGKQDWQGVCDHMQLSNGLFWPIPITLSAQKADISELNINNEVALVDAATQEIMGIMQLEEIYEIDKAHECREVFKTTDLEHPGVQMVMNQGDVNLAGPVKVFSQGEFPSRYPGVYLTPEQTRQQFIDKGWYSVAAFQTRNPMHRSHEHLVKLALEICDGVLVHSLLGQLKPGDIPAKVRQQSISTLIDHYFVANTVLQGGYPLDMRYAGPREALLHALFRQNYGCSHLIVGRDHAGVGEYYGPFDAQSIFDEIPEDALETKPLKFDWTFWCHRCDGMASLRTCPHDASERVLVSGTKLRKALSEGGDVEGHFSRPEVLTILREYYASLKDSEKVEVKLTGHSAK